MAKRESNFSEPIVRKLAQRAGYHCSKPDCDKLTVGPSNTATDGFVHIGVASHIRAASPGGPRYDATQSNEQRSSIENAIYLCQDCAHLIDSNNGADYPVALLVDWKQKHEDRVRAAFGKAVLDADFSVETTKQSAQVLLDTQIAADHARFVAEAGSSNLLDGVSVRARRTTLRADGGSLNVVQGAHFDGGSGSVSMRGVDQRGNTHVQGSSIGFGDNTVLGMGAAAMYTNQNGDFCIGFRTPVMSARCRSCGTQFDLFQQPVRGQMLTCPKCGISARVS